MPYATAKDGVRLYYEELGTGEPLLLVSGQGGDHTSWDFIRGDFVSRYRVIVYDHRGTGKSDKPTEPPYSTRGFAEDAIAILDGLGIAKAHAYGISMGGRTGQWLGIDYPERMGALVLGCTTPGNAHGVKRPAELDNFMKNPLADPQAAMKAMLEGSFTPGWIAAHSEAIALLQQQQLQNPLPAHAQRLHYLASEGHDAWDLLPGISAPTLIIHGSDDLVNPTANAYLLAERIPGAEIHIIEGGRHGYFVEFREEASRVVNEFLGRHSIN